jgi:hypothetical protein
MRSKPATGACRPDTVVPKHTSSISQYRDSTIAHAARTRVAFVIEDGIERAKGMILVEERL